MNKTILSSAGFDNKAVEEKFKELIGKDIENAKALFIPTAAVTDEQKEIVPLCRKELLESGVLEENIDIYNCDRKLDSSEILDYDAIYVCGGDPKYLLDRFNDIGFFHSLDSFWKSGGVYLGVSAGSMVLANNFENRNCRLDVNLNVHYDKGSHSGKLDIENIENINITDDQAVVMVGDSVEIIE